MKNERIWKISTKSLTKGPVIYLVSREIRTKNNWSLIYAQSQALSLKQPLIVCYCFDTNLKFHTERRHNFLKEGLIEFAKKLREKNIPVIYLAGNPLYEVKNLCLTLKASELVCDFNPLKEKLAFFKNISRKLPLPVTVIDSHNIVPCLYVSGKQEYGAYTIRPKIHKLLPLFLEQFPELKKHPFTITSLSRYTNSQNIPHIVTDKSVPPNTTFKGGEKEASKILKRFITDKLTLYGTNHNDPNLKAVSGLSPYLHFGFISAQQITLDIEILPLPAEIKNPFLEELIIRKELSDNYCFYNKNYDNINGAPAWAAKTLEQHKNDKRTYVYSRKKLEYAKTHDDLWNASQKSLLESGKMHGFLRMYWAKKILEWTKTPDYAFKTAVYLNDKYSLDGCDPKGYTGIAWSICGVHDRAWFSRDIFGKIRFMSYNGCKSKFNIKEYINYVTAL